MYLVYVSSATTPKNKLESDFSDFLNEINRTLIQDSEIKDFRKKILDNYEALCKKHNRCKPVEKSFFSGVNSEDFILAGSNTSCKLLKSK